MKELFIQYVYCFQCRNPSPLPNTWAWPEDSPPIISLGCLIVIVIIIIIIDDSDSNSNNNNDNNNDKVGEKK